MTKPGPGGHLQLNAAAHPIAALRVGAMGRTTHQLAVIRLPGTATGKVRAMHRTIDSILLGLGLGFMATACTGDRPDDSKADEGGFTTGDGTGESGGDGHGDGDGDPIFDFLEQDDTPSQSGCVTDGSCDKIDLLFVIDNSGTMGEEQLNLAANFPKLIQQLEMLTDEKGNQIDPDVNILVTTTDMGHPSCTPFQPDGYTPAQGRPVNTPCIQRLDDFTGLGSNPKVIEEACTTGCPVAKGPLDPYIHFDADGTNVPGDDVEGALSCIGPQGINGCGYEAPLESMLQAINPDAEWNQGPRPFLRDDAILAIAIVTDEADCSVRSPDGYAFFTNPMFDTYWEDNPDSGDKTQATSAVCWNAGVDCGSPDQNGEYEDCHSVDTGVLHPIDRYVDYLRDGLLSSGKEVLMLGILGVPEVTAHNEKAPYQPIAGGVDALVYRQWRDASWPTGDLLPGDPDDAGDKEWEFGIGPGCTGEDGMNGFTGQAIPPVRVKEVCQALDDGADQIRCCIESICDSDFSPALRCLSGIIQTTITPPK